jgi:hypothetical protein
VLRQGFRVRPWRAHFPVREMSLLLIVIVVIMFVAAAINNETLSALWLNGPQVTLVLQVVWMVSAVPLHFESRPSQPGTLLAPIPVLAANGA